MFSHDGDGRHGHLPLDYKAPCYQPEQKKTIADMTLMPAIVSEGCLSSQVQVGGMTGYLAQPSPPFALIPELHGKPPPSARRFLGARCNLHASYLMASYRV